MTRIAETQVFNNKGVFIGGWTWALKSAELKVGRSKGLDFLGKPLVLYRGTSGKVHALDAFCPHMGAHLKEGRVDGEGIRCAFHDWKFASDGSCTDIPCQKYADQTRAVPPLSAYMVAEHYGLIWIYTGPFTQDRAKAEAALPRFSQFDSDDVEFLVGPRTFRPCRPEVVMLNAIDAHHFNSVHPQASQLAGGLDLRARPLSDSVIRLENQSPVPVNTWMGRLLAPLYPGGRLTYQLDYWYASTGVVTLGPDFLQFHLLFPHRPTLDGGTEGIMVFLTRRRKGWLGKLFSRFVVWLIYVVGSYFEKGDRRIFESIQFSMRAPVKADHPIIEFIRHTDAQPSSALPWQGTDLRKESIDRPERPRPMPQIPSTFSTSEVIQ